MNHSPEKPRAYLIAAAVVALLTGLVALVYQIVIIRIAMFHFGAESETLASVVCMTLIGLSGGAWTFGRTSHHGNDPLKLLGCALTAATFTILLFWLLQSQLVTFLESSELSNQIQKLLFGTVAALPINFFVGSTLPLLAATLACQSNQIAANQSFAWVYSAETLGAASGAILAGFYLIPQFGLSWSLLSVASTTFIAALISFTYSRSQKRNSLSTSPDQTVFHPAVETPRFMDWLFLLSVAIAGIATMGIEIVWQRFFVLMFGSDTQSFSVVVAVYLTGISFGALLSRIMASPRDAWAAYATALTWIAVAMTLSTLALNRVALDPASLPMPYLFQASPVFFRVSVAAMLLIVPTTLIGLALPLAVRCFTNNLTLPGSSVGKIYAATLMGNVFGLLGTGTFISSGGGLRATAIFLTCFLVLAAIIVTLRNHRQGWLANRWMILAITIWVPVSVALLTTSFVPLGVDLASWNLEFYSEGKSNIVAVVSNKSNPNDRQMIIDGVKIGESIGGVNEKQQMLAHLPFLLRNNISDRNAITIGLGTGLITNALAENPDVAKVTCVELSGDVIKACESFSDINGNVLRNPKVTIENSDGIQYLRQLDGAVDVIVSDAKSRPGHSGNIAFFSREYYQICNCKLADSGIFVQWVSLETSTDAVQTIFASFKDSFDFGYVAVAPPDSVYLIGSNKPLDRAARQWDDYLTKCPQLNEYHWRSADDIASLTFLPQIEFGKKHQTVNRIDLPILERYSLSSASVSPETNKLANLKFLQNVLQAQPIPDAGATAAIELVAAAILILERPDNWLDAAGEHSKAAVAAQPKLSRQSFVADLYRQLADQAEMKDDEAKRFSAILNISEMGFASAADHFYLGTILKERDQDSQSLEHFYKARTLAPDNMDYHLQFGFSLLDSGKFVQAYRTFQELNILSVDEPRVVLGLGISQTKTGRTERGWENIRRALRMDSQLQDLFREYQ